MNASIMNLLVEAFSRIPNYIFIKDSTFVYQACNKNFAIFSGFSTCSALEGKTDYDMPWSQTHADLYRKEDQLIITTGKSFELKEVPMRIGKEEKILLISKIPLFNDIQEVAGILGIYIDISDRKKSECELLIAKKEAEAANHAKSAFIANMSHDIRTPITGMLAMHQKTLNLLNDTKIALSQSRLEPADLLKDLIPIIQQDNQLLTGATKELLILCNSILEAVQLESGKMTPQTESFNIELLVKHTVSLLQPVASDQQIDLSYTIDPALPRYLKGTRLYLDQILLNLVSNALKFTDKGFVKITVKLASDSHPPFTFKPGNLALLKLLVEDTGIGIPHDKIDTIFEHFSRLQPSYEGLYKGSGLGLYAVKRYVEVMKGHIDVNSTLGKGSCFTLTLPFLLANKSDALLKSDESSDLPMLEMTPQAIVQKTQPQPWQAAGSKLSIPTAKPVILIVEDNKLAALGLQMGLKPFGCAIDLAENGTQAIEMAKNKQYDLIFMDVGLPDFSGIEATKKIRGMNTKHAQTPIVAVTGHAGNPDERQACLDAGMQAVLNKPAQELELQSVFQTYVLDDSNKAVSEPLSLSTFTDKKVLKIIDWKACLLMCRGDEELLQQSLSILTEDLQTTESLLSQAYKKRDATALRAELHRTLGGVCHLKLPELEETLKAFHQAVKTDFQNQNCLERTYVAVQQAMKNFWETSATLKTASA